jgi:predicted DNA-binding transcriptional regulator AlpA
MASKAKRAKGDKPRPLKVDKPRAPSLMEAQPSLLQPQLLIAARLSKRLGVSAVTLWRWRHDERLGFPKGRRINDRVYFEWPAVCAWLYQQKKVA